MVKPMENTEEFLEFLIDQNRELKAYSEELGIIWSKP